MTYYTSNGSDIECPKCKEKSTVWTAPNKPLITCKHCGFIAGTRVI